ncbi:hypothetical protein [Tardiphaga sp. OK245]|uniref:hypothetical protein n=1 Tax=Tardiphaga sp. OK245 TaxID=1855306 RepID=UPI0008A7339C|nr:hypothetical protein [Tardiphaga sp. OK245]SEH44618.1 hypothetical protein SAMN05216367_0347 [Tardiphaga sp. OK245]
MTSMLEKWARTEREYLREEIKYFKAGGKATSPSGEDITSMRLEQLAGRLEGANLALKEVEDAQKS